MTPGVFLGDMSSKKTPGVFYFCAPNVNTVCVLYS